MNSTTGVGLVSKEPSTSAQWACSSLVSGDGHIEGRCRFKCCFLSMVLCPELRGGEGERGGCDNSL